jgi:hypothetical protein
VIIAARASVGIGWSESGYGVLTERVLNEDCYYYYYYYYYYYENITISHMQGTYTYIPETKHVPKEYNVAAIL